MLMPTPHASAVQLVLVQKACWLCTKRLAKLRMGG